MRYSLPGLGERIRRARNGTGLSQTALAEKIGVSWMTVHRWERSQRQVPDHLLDRLCEISEKPLRWFLTLEDGDLEASTVTSEKLSESSAAAKRLSRKIIDSPVTARLMIEKVVEGMLDGLKRADY